MRVGDGPSTSSPGMAAFPSGFPGLRGSEFLVVRPGAGTAAWAGTVFLPVLEVRSASWGGDRSPWVTCIGFLEPSKGDSMSGSHPWFSGWGLGTSRPA